MLPDPQQGTRSYIRVLRLLEKFTLPQQTAAIEYALDIDLIDADGNRTMLEPGAISRWNSFRFTVIRTWRMCGWSRPTFLASMPC